MNKLDLQPGGHPLTIEDLLLLQDAHFAGFDAIGSMFQSPNYPAWVISGLDCTAISPGVVSVSDGYVFYENEIWFVQGISSIPLGYIYLSPNISFIAPTPVTYANGGSVNVKQLRMMTISAGALPVGSFYLGYCGRLWQLLRDKATPWQNITYFGANVSSSTGAYAAKHQRNVIGDIRLRGRIIVNVASLPLGMSSLVAFMPPFQLLELVTVPVLSRNGYTFKLSTVVGGIVMLSTHNELPFAQNNYVDIAGGFSGVSASLNLEIILDNVVFNDIG